MSNVNVNVSFSESICSKHPARAFWHRIYLLTRLPSFLLFLLFHFPYLDPIWSNLVNRCPILKSLSRWRQLQSALLPCCFPLKNSILCCDHTHSVFQSMWVLWFPFCTKRPLYIEHRGTERNDQEERQSHLFIIQLHTVANLFDLRRHDCLLMIMIHTAALIRARLKWKSQLLQWVLVPCIGRVHSRLFWIKCQ